MQGSKLKQVFVDLDRARCTEKWKDIPELAKKYKKHYPQESVFELTARLEAEFILLLQQFKNDDMIHTLDDPNHVAQSKRLLATQVQLVLVRLLDVIQRQLKSGELETPDDWQAQFSKIILARIYFETRRYDKALEWLQSLALRLEDVESGYGLVLLVQARVIKARCLEEQDDPKALESYMSALSAVEEHPKEKNMALNYWIEDGLYRSILLQLRKKGPVKQTMKLMRSYLNYCRTQQWPLHWRIHKRWIIFRHYIRYLTRAYQKGVYVPIDETSSDSSSSALNETMQLVSQFQILLNESVKLSSLELNHKTLELCHLLVAAHDTIGWGPKEYKERISKFFHQARAYTFNSISLSRHIFHLHTSLGQSKLTKLSFKNYLQLLGITELEILEEDEDHSILYAMTEKIQESLQSITRDSLASASKYLEIAEKTIKDGLDELSVANTTKRKVPLGAFENDNVFDVVHTILVALKHGFVDLSEEGLVLSDMAIHLLEESEGLKRTGQWKTWMAQSRRYRGCFYGQYAVQCNEPEKRLNCLTEALASLTRASELDTQSWEIFFELGLQQATVGQMAMSVESIKKSIELKDNFIPSWHLLALLQSSGIFQDIPKALCILHMTAQHNAIEDDTLDSELFEKAIAFMKLKMSQLFILEDSEGCCPEVYAQIFNLYSRLSKKMGLTSAIIPHESQSDDMTSSSIQSRVSSHKVFRHNSSVRSEISLQESIESFAVLEKKGIESKNGTLSASQQENGSSQTLITKKRSKRSFSLSETRPDDPLLGFSDIRKMKEKNSIQSTRSAPLSLKSSLENNNDSAKDIQSSYSKSTENKINQSIQPEYPPSDSGYISLSDQERWKQIAVELWIMTSQSCLRNDQYEEALKALYEADQLTNGMDAHVWYNIGLVFSSCKRERRRAMDAFKMALTLDPEHVATSISIASIYLDTGKVELAEFLLEKVTEGLGWNHPEAWYLLSRVYMKQESLMDAKNCVMYALKLSETGLIYSLDRFPRFV
ncbi:unnamed protein product [Rhizopus stolonifer]